jgi:hypothetical protein
MAKCKHGVYQARYCSLCNPKVDSDIAARVDLNKVERKPKRNPTLSSRLFAAKQLVLKLERALALRRPAAQLAEGGAQ